MAVTTRQTHKLTADQRVLMLEWLSEGLTNAGVRAHMEAYNHAAAEHNKQNPNPQDQKAFFLHVTSACVTYWRKKLARQVDEGLQQYQRRLQSAVNAGLRNRDYRVGKLIQAAEVLEPYLGTASPRGEFTASIQYVSILGEIRKEVGQDSPDKDVDLTDLTIDQLRDIATAIQRPVQP